MPQAVIGGLTFQDLSLGEVSCGISTNRNLYCWGYNFGGFLGIGRVYDPYVPTPTKVTATTG